MVDTTCLDCGHQGDFEQECPECFGVMLDVKVEGREVPPLGVVEEEPIETDVEPADDENAEVEEEDNPEEEE